MLNCNKLLVKIVYIDIGGKIGIRTAEEIAEVMFK